MENFLTKGPHPLTLLTVRHAELNTAFLHADRLHLLAVSCRHDLPDRKIKCAHKYSHVCAR